MDEREKALEELRNADLTLKNLTETFRKMQEQDRKEPEGLETR